MAPPIVAMLNPPTTRHGVTPSTSAVRPATQNHAGG